MTGNPMYLPLTGRIRRAIFIEKNGTGIEKNGTGLSGNGVK
ncbi:MAG: hypothetical protein V2I79_01105 [Xanthomonadales bacterium]|jgi:hypothetical protein|nr:hypothetical protein [Xanthomonadales bacterium]